MKRSAPWVQSTCLSTDDSLDDEQCGSAGKKPNIKIGGFRLYENNVSEDAQLIRRAEMYQEYMKSIPIPTKRGSVIPFTSWQGLAKSVKQLYGQPLHYLTNILLKQWDKARIGSIDECQPVDSVIHPAKAEAVIWVIEEVHRFTSSHHYLAKLWSMDPMYHANIDAIFS